MSAELFEALELLEKTKGIPVDYMLEKVEAALVSAYKKEEGSTSVRVAVNREKRQLKLYHVRTVVEEVTDPKSEISLEDAQRISKRYTLGTTVEDEVKTKNFGRISAQTAKQVIVQGIREAEKTNIIRDYERKREEVISAVVVKRDDTNGDVVVDTGTSNALLPRNEQIPGEELYVGDRVRVFICEVGRVGERGPMVMLSRTHPAMVKRMFETEIPEIADGIVLVKGVAREAGSRTKIAVMSRDEMCIRDRCEVIYLADAAPWFGSVKHTWNTLSLFAMTSVEDAEGVISKIRSLFASGATVRQG